MLKLSESILSRVPEFRQAPTLSNLTWIGRNISQDGGERQEVLTCIRLKREELARELDALKAAQSRF